MDKLTLKSYAKINLNLKIGATREDGYHELSSLMQQVNLFDVLTFRKLDENKILIKCNKKELENENNIAYKAALLVKNRFNMDSGVEIDIEKNIPIGAGLAGGSGNAAVTLKALNELWNLNLKEDELIKLGRELGSDVPFQIVGKTALVEGTGEKITKADSIKEDDVLIIKPDVEISTKWAYEELDKLKSIHQSENDFESLVAVKYPIINEIKKELLDGGAVKALMSGSGPSVFGLFDNRVIAEKAYNNLKDKYHFVFLTKTIK